MFENSVRWDFGGCVVGGFDWRQLVLSLKEGKKRKREKERGNETKEGRGEGEKGGGEYRWGKC